MTTQKINEEVGRKIALLRRSMNLTQEEVAQIVGISRVSFVNIERGKQMTTLLNLLKIRSVLGVTPNDILPKPPKATIKTVKLTWK